ncbi:MAG: SDR family NAD(P)-dependent oxidoreductase [Actinobacteria bacterium]|nr:MAG: SDR family NAD(P)-dependent oxidoreductase [Actinomycetota bacterium]
MTQRLAGKVVIVTGGAGSIGREHSLLFAKQGARVVVNDLGVSSVGDGQMASADRVVDEIRADGGEAIASSASAATFAGAETIVQQAVDAFGTVDILVNNATAGGINDIWRFSERQFDKTVDANFKGYFAMIKYAAPHMCRQGSGVIVNTSSGSGFGHPSNSVYAAAKEALIGLTRTAARELGRFGVRCNAIRPSAASYTALNSYQELTARWAELMNITMRPKGAPPEAASASFDPDARPPRKVSPFVVWLCTDAARNVNGRTFHVYGDFVARYSEPEDERIIFAAGGWDLDMLDAAAPQLTSDLTNDYTLDEYPALKVFDE